MGKTVLVVDDMPVNRDLVRTVLGYHGHQTLEARGGAEALALLTHEHPDLVLTDVMMPGMDGFELARAIRADSSTKGIPVLFYTANYLVQESAGDELVRRNHPDRAQDRRPDRTDRRRRGRPQHLEVAPCGAMGP